MVFSGALLTTTDSWTDDDDDGLSPIVLSSVPTLEESIFKLYPYFLTK